MDVNKTESKKKEIINQLCILATNVDQATDVNNKAQEMYRFFDYLVENKELIWIFPVFKEFIEVVWDRLNHMYLNEPKFDNEKAIRYLKELFPDREIPVKE